MAETFKNRLLFATPTLNDPYFQKTVILLFEHSEKGAMGLIINKPLDICVGEILKHLNIPLTHSSLDDDKVMLGGPIAPEQGFIVHTHPEICPGDIIDEEKKITVSASKEVLEKIIDLRPKDMLICLGYSVWEKNQLETEIAENAWFLTNPNSIDHNILFKLPPQERWLATGKLLKINLDQLSSDVGHG